MINDTAGFQFRKEPLAVVRELNLTTAALVTSFTRRLPLFANAPYDALQLLWRSHIG